jgi:hypothetical protein
MRLLIILTLALMTLAGSGQAFGAPGSVVVDIVGSTTDNTRIESAASENVVLEIVGSEAKDTVIAPPAKKQLTCPQIICPKPDCPKPDCSPKVDCQKKCYPWDSMHLGVDAWYGTFWYTDINMPKWPQF